jgi:hypothetical protein
VVNEAEQAVLELDRVYFEVNSGATRYLRTYVQGEVGDEVVLPPEALVLVRQLRPGVRERVLILCPQLDIDEGAMHLVETVEHVDLFAVQVADQIVHVAHV